MTRARHRRPAPTTPAAPWLSPAGWDRVLVAAQWSGVLVAAVLMLAVVGAAA